MQVIGRRLTCARAPLFSLVTQVQRNLKRAVHGLLKIGTYFEYVNRFTNSHCRVGSRNDDALRPHSLHHGDTPLRATHS